MNLGLKIKKFRLLKNITQQYLAEQIGISQRYLSRIESNQSDIKFLTLLKICDVLEINFFELTGLNEKENHDDTAYIIELIKLCESRISHLEKEIHLLRNQLSKNGF